MKAFKVGIVVLFLLAGTQAFAQRGRGHHGVGRGHHPHPNKVVVVRHSPYRPNKIVVFHPYWRPAFGYHRRWVFFPRYNIYWDNWRNHYVFWNGTVWLSQAAVPPVIVNVNLDKEKSTELKEDEDDVDDIYKSNETHKTEHKAD
jgi:hypothetical protein